MDNGDGESVIRRNGHTGQRLVVDDIEEIGRLIISYGIYRFVPDVNRYGSSFEQSVTGLTIP